MSEKKAPKKVAEKKAKDAKAGVVETAPKQPVKFTGTRRFTRTSV